MGSWILGGFWGLDGRAIHGYATSSMCWNYDFFVDLAPENVVCCGASYLNILLTHSPPQPLKGGFCFEPLIPRTANWWVRLSSSGSPEQPFGSFTLLAVFKLTVTLLVKIIKYDDRLVFVLLIYAKNRMVTVKNSEKTEL